MRNKRLSELAMVDLSLAGGIIAFDPISSQVSERDRGERNDFLAMAGVIVSQGPALARYATGRGWGLARVSAPVKALMTGHVWLRTCPGYDAQVNSLVMGHV